MAISIIERSFDTVLQNRATPIFAVSGDYNARFIEATITTNGVPQQISKDALVIINITRPDGENDGFSGEVSGEHSVTVPIPQWALEVPGSVLCNISVLGAGTKYTTTRFTVAVQEKLWEGETPSEDDPNYDIWQTVLAVVEETNAKLELPLEKGISENSVQMAGSVAGLKGFYWSAIDVSNKTITLSTVNGSYGTEQEFDISEYWAVGDIITIHSGNKYLDCSTIIGMYGNTIDVDALPFTSPTSESGHITDQAVYVLAKPDKGLCDFGQYSVAMGEGSEAVSFCTYAFGRDNRSIGQYGFTGGRENEAGYAAAVFGRANSGRGDASFVAGNVSSASGKNAVAVGRNLTVSGDMGFAANSANKVYGIANAALNGSKEEKPNSSTTDGNDVYGTCNLAIGNNNTAYNTAVASLVGGSGCTVSAKNGIALGDCCEVTKDVGVAFGYNTAVHAVGGAVFGSNSTVHEKANTSFIGGNSCNSYNDSASLFGRGLKSSANSQTTVGQYNALAPNARFVVGNGTSDTARSNAFEVLNDGSARLGEKAVATEEYVDGVKSELSADISTVESIAKGANQAVAFGTYFEMIDELHAASQDSYRVGQNFYIKTFDVPDLWVRGVFSSYTHCDYVTNKEIVEQLNTYGVIVVGHYSLSPLETQKVDLTEYPTISEMQSYVNEAILGGTW